MNKLLSILIVLAGCGEAPEIDDEVPVVEGKADSLSFLPAPGDTATHLYFDNTQVTTLTSGPQYWVFTARAYHSFTATERGLVANSTTGATDPKAKVGFKLYRLARSNHYYWKLISSVDGKKGVANYSYKGETSRYYLLEASAGQFPTDISVALACGGGDHKVCALGGQPRDLCGTRGVQACDSGLYCQFESGCGADDRGGECAVQPTVCPRGILCYPVCGCDGNTYCRGCNIASHGISQASEGSCECDENQYEDAAGVTPAGSYSYIDPSSNSHYTYSFDGGKLTSQYEPGCLFSNPHCNIRVAQKTGSYTVNGDDTLTLSYSDGTSATLITQTNCRGTARIAGTDYGILLYLTQ